MAIRGREGKKAKKANADRRRTGGLCVGVERDGRCTADSTPGCPFLVSVLCFAFWRPTHKPPVRRRSALAFFAFFPLPSAYCHVPILSGLLTLAMCPYRPGVWVDAVDSRSLLRSMEPSCCVCNAPARDRRRRVLLLGTSEKAKSSRGIIETYYAEERNQNVALEEVFSAGSYCICGSCISLVEEFPKLKAKWDNTLFILNNHLPSLQIASITLGTPVRRSRPPGPLAAMSTPKRLRAGEAIQHSPQVQVRIYRTL